MGGVLATEVKTGMALNEGEFGEGGEDRERTGVQQVPGTSKDKCFKNFVFCFSKES